jgi:hypothetical protein
MPRPGHIRIARKPTSLGHTTGVPLRAAILTIDAATRSGVAIYVGGKLHHYAEVQAFDGPARRRVVRDATTIAEVRALPMALVIEVPWGGRAQAALSLNAVVKLWRDSWLGAGHREEHMIELTANEWRRAFFGKAGMPREQARQLEAAHASRIAADDMPRMRHYKIGGDAAAAICIGQVVIRSSAVASVLGLPTTTDRRYTV